jgi:hypothetical protein
MLRKILLATIATVAVVGTAEAFPRFWPAVPGYYIPLRGTPAVSTSSADEAGASLNPIVTAGLSDSLIHCDLNH